MGAAITSAAVTAAPTRSPAGASARVRTTAPAHSAAAAIARMTIAPGASPLCGRVHMGGPYVPLGGAGEGAGLPLAPDMDLLAGWPERVEPGSIADESR